MAQPHLESPPAGSRRNLWPLAGVAAGILGVLGTFVTDIHVEGDGTRGEAMTMADVSKVDQFTAHLSIIFGFLAVTALLIVAACWRKWVEPSVPGSVAARLVTQAMTAAAGALSLGYGWKGASAIYHADGMDSGTYDEMGLYVYYILNDFGSFIGWFGVTVAAGAVAWMALRERSLPIWLGVWSLIPVLAVISFTGGTGLPGFPGVVSPIWMIVAFGGLAFTRLAPAAAGERPTNLAEVTAYAD